MDEPMMTEAERDELKTLCQKADVPDTSGELLTREGAGAQHSLMIGKSGWPSASKLLTQIIQFVTMPWVHSTRGAFVSKRRSLTILRLATLEPEFGCCA